MAVVELKGVHKVYGSGRDAVEVLHGIDCAIAHGEFMVLVGPSGCGKSTLLRMIAGLELITGGEIFIGGRCVNEVEPKDRDIAMVFQNYALYPHMTVRRNLAYGLTLRGTPKDEIAVRVQKAARMLELEPYLDRKPRDLSGGQRQRVAMGRAIVRNPAVFLFDEPLSNLDAKLRVQTRIELQKLHREFGTTSIYVTHDQVEAMTLGERLMVMNQGRAEQVGKPMEVYHRPASTFVASFIGSPPMNLFPGRVEGSLFHTAVGNTPLRIFLPATPPRAGELTLGIRPEHLKATTLENAKIVLSITMLEMLGADSYAYGGANANGQMICSRLTSHDTINTGDLLPLGFEAEHIHWFDTASGRRIE